MKKCWPGTLTEVKYQNPCINTEDFLQEYINAMVLKVNTNEAFEPLLLKFYTHKREQWRYEKEYRILTFGFASTITSLKAMNLGTLKKYFKTRTLPVQNFYDISQLFPRVNHTELSDLKTSGYMGFPGVNEQPIINIPHYDTLFIKMPKPKKIILGWNVEKYKELKIKDICSNSNIKLSKVCIPSGIDSNSNSYYEIVIYNPESGCD